MRIMVGLALAAAAAATALAACDGPRATIRTSDVATFYRLYDAAQGSPSAERLQRDYVDRGSAGVREFVPHRILSGAALAETVRAEPRVYARARTCLSALPAAKARLRVAFRRLAQLDPDARFPPVTILIGRNNSGGTTGPSGVLIGLEVVCGSSWLQADPADRLTHLVAHEYGHVQQPAALEEGETNVLKQSLVEGVAELLAELTSGEVSNVHLQRWTRGREREIGTRFLAARARRDLSAWLYNGAGTPDQPGDLGYWVGYRIAKAYYDRAGDKRAALRTLLDLRDPDAILAASGWRP